MSKTYEELLRTGYLANLKANVLIEADRDLFHLIHIRNRFMDDQHADELRAVELARELAADMVRENYCTLATWGQSQGAHELVADDDEALRAFFEQQGEDAFEPFIYFLIATDRGRDWIARHKKLLDEL